MKLYIPTCTLNFNNIFSSESISPLSFYQKRGFGNKRFYPAPANNFENVIMLYSKYPRYTMDSSDIENYPMVIEIETSDYQNDYFSKVLEKEGVEVFICSKTIYLNPFHCFVYFDSYEERQGVMTKAEQSLENKFSKLYSANLRVKPVEKRSMLDGLRNLFSQTEQDDFSWSSSFVNFNMPDINSDYKRDVVIDRVKGFLYCYLIGANQSVSPDTGQLKAIARNLRNTLSAVVNSPDKRPSKAQDDALLDGINKFNEIYSTKDVDSIQNKIVLENRLSSNPLGLPVEDCVRLLKSWNVFDTFCSKINLRKVYDAGELWSCLEYPTSDNYNSAIERMQYAVRRIELNDLSNSPKADIRELVEIDEENKVKVSDSCLHGPFYQYLINSQICGDYMNIMNENGVEEPLAQAFNGGQILKRIMGDKWEGSPVSTYINNLLSHFQESTSFNLFSYENEVATSFAAFCQKGDNIDRLAEYLVQCGFSNYRLAYGIFGATRGFASLPKTFTSSLINGDKEYFRKSYLSIYSLLFKLNLQSAEYPQLQHGNSAKLVESQIGTTIVKNISKVETKPSKQASILSAVTNAVELEDAVQSPKAFMYILDSFPRMTTTKAYKNLKAAGFADDEGTYTPDSFRSKIYSIVGKDNLKGQKEKIDYAIELESKRQDSKAFLSILDNFMDPNSAPYKKIAALLNDTVTERPKTSVQSQVPNLEHQTSQSTTIRTINKTSDLFVDDKNVAAFILTRSYLYSDIRELLSQKVMSFQEDYAPGGYYYGQLESPRTNDNTIKHFINKCTYQKGQNPSWVPATPENKQLLERLKNELYERYAK